MGEPDVMKTADQCEKPDSPFNVGRDKMVEDDLVLSQTQVNRTAYRSASLSIDVVLDTESPVDNSPKDTENGIDFVESEKVTTQLSSLTLSPEPSLKRRKLILHFDARNTVFVADISSRITIEQALNTYLSGVVWGYCSKEDEWYPSENPISLRAPDSMSTSLYKHMECKIVKKAEDRGRLRQVLGNFTATPFGAQYRNLFERHLGHLAWPSGAEPDPKLTVAGNDGQTYHYLLPAFLHLIEHMRLSGREFCVVVRTFGRDAPHILEAVSKFARGEHPSFPGARPNLQIDPHVHRFKRFVDGGFAYSYAEGDAPEAASAGDDDLRTKLLTSEREIYELWNRCEGVIAVVDDFNYWQRHQYHYTAAKPLWFSQRDRRVQHILFDDNIRVEDDDSILNLCRLVSVETEGGRRRPVTRPIASAGCRKPIKDERVSPRRAYVDLEPVLASRYEDVFFVQADLLESTTKHDYFIKKVKECEENYNTLFASAK